MEENKFLTIKEYQFNEFRLMSLICAMAATIAAVAGEFVFTGFLMGMAIMCIMMMFAIAIFWKD